MSGRVHIRNRRRKHRIDLRLLRWITRALVRDLLGREEFDLAIWLVGSDEIADLNERFLRHAGPTDVITFDYAEPGASDALHGEIFVCLDEARSQSARYRVPWQHELVRYVVHGVLHLCGYDDQRPADRRRMKRAEDRLLKQLATQFYLRKLDRSRARLAARTASATNL